MRPLLTLGLILSLSLLLAPLTSAGKTYVWIDEQGNKHYSDHLPPDAVDKPRRELDKQGIEKDRKEAAKTPEELVRARELERLKQEQERLLAEQLERDELLLKTFPTEEDLILAREKKLEAVDSQIKLTESNIKRYKARLAEMQRDAGNVERQGRTVSQRLLNDIDATRRQIEGSYAYIVGREEEKLDIRERFDRDLARLRELRAMRTAEPTIEEAPRGRTVFLETLVSCASTGLCDEYWVRARRFAKDHASTPLLVSGERIYMTAAPIRDEDLSLTVSRIPGESGAESIFLDIQCRDTTMGRQFCTGPAVAEVRDGFRPTVMSP